MNTFHSMMKLVSKKSVAWTLMGLCSFVSFAPSQAQAEGFAIQDWSARGAALAGGLVARGGDASAVAYNPAAITELEGTQIMIGGELVTPSNTMVANDGTEYDSEDLLFAIPTGYITHKFNDTVSFGVGLFSRFGLGNGYEEGWPGSANVHDVSILTTTLNPNVAVKLTDDLSVAIGLEIMYAQVELSKWVVPGVSASDTTVEGDGMGLGFNAALHYRINKDWNFGLTYRSGEDLDYSGDATGAIKDGGKAYMSLPHHISTALSWQATDALSLEAGVQYFMWSKYDTLRVDFDDDRWTDMNEKKNWQDTWFFSLSAEYQALEWLALRAGISYETSSTDETYADFMAPTDGRWKYSVGAGITHEQWVFDLAYVYSDLNSLDYDESIYNRDYAGGKVSHSKDSHAHALVVGVSYKF